MSSAEMCDLARKSARKVEGGNGGPEPAVVRSQAFYFNDGTIALRASSKNGTCHTIYRVHKSLLALHCSVFHDMFGDNDTVHFDAASEKYDGVPLMHIHDESWEIEIFLDALYKPGFMQRYLEDGAYHAGFPGSYNHVMRLAKKYGSQTLLSAFARALRREWPSNLKLVSAVRQSRAAEREVLEDGGYHFDGVDPESVMHPHPAWTIRMAIDYDVPEVLPLAFAALSARLAPGLGRATEDGDSCLEVDLEDGLSILKADERMRLFIGGQTLASYVFEFTSKRPVPGQDTFVIPSSSSHKCYKHFCSAWKRMMVNLENTHGSFHPFEMFRNALTDVDLCGSCRPRAQLHVHAIELDLWKRLPAIFDLHGYGVSEDWGS